MWPTEADTLIAEQQRLGRSRPELWRAPPGHLLIAGCFVCFARARDRLPPPRLAGDGGDGAVRAEDGGGDGAVRAEDGGGDGPAGDPAWAAAVLFRGRRYVAGTVRAGSAYGPYEPGLLALREGALLESALRDLPDEPEVVLVNATGRDHPRRAGLALHLGAVIGVPTVGVTHRPLIATSLAGRWPPDRYGATSPLVIDAEEVGCWLRTRTGVRPLAVHAAWRTDPAAATDVVLRSWCRHRTPEPLRQARRLARAARAA